MLENDLVDLGVLHDLNTTRKLSDEEMVRNAILAIKGDYPITQNVWFRHEGLKQEEDEEHDQDEEQAQAQAQKKPDEKYLKLHTETNVTNEVISALAENSCIKRLGFSKYELTDESMKELGKTLAKNESLTSITFDCCNLTPAGISHLADALENNPYLTKIHFLNMPFENADAEKIAKALKKNQSLKTISFNDCEITSEGASALIEGLKKNYHITKFNFESNNAQVKEIIQKGKQEVLARNNTCANLCEYLNGTFTNMDKSFQDFYSISLDEARDLSYALDDFKTRINNSLSHISDYIKRLKAQGYPIVEWEFKLARARSKLHLLLQKEMSLSQLFDAYLQHFSDGTDEIINDKLAKKLLSALNEDGNAFQSLGIDDQLGYRWLLKLLKGNPSEEAKEIRENIYHQKLGYSFGCIAPQILTIAELEKVKKVLESSKHETLAGLKGGQRCENFDDITFSTEEKFAASVLNTLNKADKEIIIYEEWMLNARTERVKSPYQYNVFNNGYNRWFKLFKHQIEAAKQQEKEWEARFFPPLHRAKISRNITDIVQRGDYVDVVDKGVSGALSPDYITMSHSRAVSVRRIAKDSFSKTSCTYEQTKRILQIEYDALPDQDKSGAFHYTFWRHCTLEHYLEKVFKQNNIIPLHPEDLSEAEKLAAFLLSWIGNQERRFAYKVLKNPALIDNIEYVGQLAHRIITGEFAPNEDDVRLNHGGNAFKALKACVIKDIKDKCDEEETKKEIEALVSEINLKFPAPPTDKVENKI